MVTGLQGQIEQFPGHHHVAVADQIEDGFHLMGKGGNVVETKHCTGALDGMHCAEDAIDEILITGCLFQFKQGCFKFGQQFSRFLAIAGGKLFKHGINPHGVGKFAGASCTLSLPRDSSLIRGPS